MLTLISDAFLHTLVWAINNLTDFEKSQLRPLFDYLDIKILDNYKHIVFMGIK